MVAFIDEKRRYRYVNKAYCQFFNLKKADILVGSYPTFLMMNPTRVSKPDTIKSLKRVRLTAF